MLNSGRVTWLSSRHWKVFHWSLRAGPAEVINLYCTQKGLYVLGTLLFLHTFLFYLRDKGLRQIMSVMGVIKSTRRLSRFRELSIKWARSSWPVLLHRIRRGKRSSSINTPPIKNLWEHGCIHRREPGVISLKFYDRTWCQLLFVLITSRLLTSYLGRNLVEDHSPRVTAAQSGHRET